MTKKRLNWVDYAKGIAIILVVYGHVVGGAQEGGIKISEGLILSKKIIYHFHMPLFFFLSGLFVSGSFLKRGFGGFIWNKVKTLVYPYFLWSILQGIVLVVISKYTYLDYSFYDISHIFHKPMLHYWFLYALFLMCIVYSFAIKLNIFSMPALMVLSLLVYLYPININYASIGEFCRFFIFFFAGIVWQKHFAGLKVENKQSVFATILMVLAFIGNEILIEEVYSKQLALFGAALFGLGATTLMSKYFAEKEYLPLLKLIGTYSMPIYLVHGLAGSGARIFMYDFLGLRREVILVGVSTIIGIFVPILICRSSVRLKFNYLFELK